MRCLPRKTNVGTGHLILSSAMPRLLARVRERLRWQTRRPDAVVVTDDGSTVSYARVIARYPEVIWLRTANQGKKHAQATAFREVPWADILVTIDSDSALEQRAI